MPGRDRILSSRLSITGSSALRKMEGKRKGSGPPRRPKIYSGMKSKPLRRRSQSPGPSAKTTLPSSSTKRRLPLSLKYGSAARKTYRGTRVAPKRSKASPSNRISLRHEPQSPVLSESRHRSRESRGRSERDRHSSADRPSRGTSEKKYVDTCPSERAPSVKEFKCDREELKMLTMTIRQNISGESSQINRNIVRPEDIKIVRRPGEGLTPIFSRLELIQTKVKSADEDLMPPHLDRIQAESSTGYSDTYRIINYSEKENKADVSGSRHSREEDARLQTDRARQVRSTERSRNIPQEKTERYAENRIRSRRSRSLDGSRERSNDRIVRRRRSRSLDRSRPRSDARRNFSPAGESNRHQVVVREHEGERHRSRERRYGSAERRYGSAERRYESAERKYGSAERRHGSAERRHGSSERRHGSSERRHGSSERRYESSGRTRLLERRDDDQAHCRKRHPSGDKFSSDDRSYKGHGYNQVGSMDSPRGTRGRGRGFFYPADRGGAHAYGVPFMPTPSFIVGPIPHARGIRRPPFPNVVGPGRRPVFYPRFVQPPFRFFTPMRPRQFM